MWLIFCVVYICAGPLTQGVPALTQWWGLHGKMILRAVLSVMQLLVGPPVPDRSKMMTQTKRDTLILLVGCRAKNPTPLNIVTKPTKKKKPIRGSSAAAAENNDDCCIHSVVLVVQAMWASLETGPQIFVENVQEIARCQKILPPTI